MKHVFGLIVATCIFILFSCKSSSNRTETFEPKNVSEIASSLVKRFGKDASYTDITISYIKQVGATVSATGTQDPSSGKVISKLKSKGTWEDVSETTLEIEGDAKPIDFMFTLNDVENLKKIPDMVKLSVEKIKKEKNFDVAVERVSIHGPTRITKPDEDKFSYSVNLKPEAGGTNFIMLFDDKGNFEKMIY